MFYFYSASLLYLTFQKAALECTTVGWGSCTLVGAAIDDKGLTISLTDLLTGRTINGTLFGGQYFFSFNFLHSSTESLIMKIIERKGK